MARTQRHNKNIKGVFTEPSIQGYTYSIVSICIYIFFHVIWKKRCSTQWATKLKNICINYYFLSNGSDWWYYLTQNRFQNKFELFCGFSSTVQHSTSVKLLHKKYLDGRFEPWIIYSRLEKLVLKLFQWENRMWNKILVYLFTEPCYGGIFLYIRFSSNN